MQSSIVTVLSLLFVACAATPLEDAADLAVGDPAAVDPIQAPAPACVQSAITGVAPTVHHLSPIAGVAMGSSSFAVSGLWIPTSIGARLFVPIALDSGEVIQAITVDGDNTEGSLVRLVRSDGAASGGVELGVATNAAAAGLHQNWAIVAPHAAGATQEVVDANPTSYMVDIAFGGGIAGGGTSAFGAILVKTTPFTAAAPGC